MFDEAFHEGGVATDPDLKMKVCKGRRFQLGFHVILRMFEARETCLSKRVDVNDGRSAEFGISQCREHTRMIRARVLSDHHDDVGMIEVIQRDRSFTDTNRLNEPFST